MAKKNPADLLVVIKKYKEALKQHDLLVSKLYKKTTGCSPIKGSSFKQQLNSIVDYLNNLIGLLPGHIYWLNKNNIYLGCNDEHARAAGLSSRKDIVGKRNKEMPWKDIAEFLDKNNRLVMQSNKTLSTEETATIANNQTNTYLSVKTPLHDKSGNVIGIVGTSLDITELKRLQEQLTLAKERAEEASRAKSEFLENMRHDIRTPLAGIVGFANLMRSSKAKSKEKMDEYASNLSAAGQALLNLLNEVLEAVKVSTGEIPILKKKFDLKALCQAVIDLNQAKAKQKNLNLTLSYSNKIPHYLVGDPIRIHRILLELVGNALNFTSRGFIAIKVTLDEPSEEQKKKGCVVVNLSVKDTGIGMTEAQQQELYVRFKRFVPSYQGIYSGAGLGLSIIKQFSDDIEGELHVASQPQKGTTFTCLIPLKPSLTDSAVDVMPLPKTEKAIIEEIEPPKIKSSKKTTQTISPKKQVKPAKAIRVLLVEDSPLAATAVKDMLVELGCEIDMARDGSSAIQSFQKSIYELVLMDIGLPDMDGYEVTKQIRFLEGRKENPVPIIALSAHADTDYKKRCIEAGMNAVFTKPLMQEQAEDILKAFVHAQTITEERKLKLAATTKNSTKPAATTVLVCNIPKLEGDVIDLKAASKMGLSEKAILGLLPLLDKSLKEDIPTLKNAYQKKELEALANASHKIKGGACYCGAMRLKEVCGCLETCAREGGKKDDIKDLYQLVLKEADLAREEIPKMLDKDKACRPLPKMACRSPTSPESELLVLTGTVLDLAKANQLCEPHRFETEFLPLFAKSMLEDLNQLQEAYQRGDWKSVEDITLKIKGAALYCAANRMTEACRRLMQYLEEGKTELRQPLYKQLVNETKAVMKNINAILSKSKKEKAKKAA